MSNCIPLEQRYHLHWVSECCAQGSWWKVRGLSWGLNRQPCTDETLAGQAEMRKEENMKLFAHSYTGSLYQRQKQEPDLKKKKLVSHAGDEPAAFVASKCISPPVIHTAAGSAQ